MVASHRDMQCQCLHVVVNRTPKVRWPGVAGLYSANPEGAEQKKDFGNSLNRVARRKAQKTEHSHPHSALPRLARDAHI